MSEHNKWLRIIKEHFERHGTKGAFQILFPEYRPDLARALAHYLEIEFYDYRKSSMLSRGWDAGKISLEEMTRTLLQESEKSDLVIHNIEALLGTKEEAERKQWLTDFFSIKWPNTIILPLAIFQSDTPEGHPRVCDIELVQLPRQSFLMQLAI